MASREARPGCGHLKSHRFAFRPRAKGRACNLYVPFSVFLKERNETILASHALGDMAHLLLRGRYTYSSLIILIFLEYSFGFQCTHFRACHERRNDRICTPTMNRFYANSNQRWGNHLSQINNYSKKTGDDEVLFSISFVYVLAALLTIAGFIAYESPQLNTFMTLDNAERLAH
jgi:hypothetical protein